MSEAAAPEAAPTRCQIVNFVTYKLDPAWRLRPD